MSFQFDSMKYAYASSRKVVFAQGGMVCASQPLVAQAGLDIIKKGGNAIDAAVAAAACLTVMEPTGCGIGSDAFALVYTNGKLHGLNASGPAPADIDVEALRREHGEKMPTYGWEPVTVPGAVAGWRALSNKFGRLPFSELMAPAIKYAAEGFPVSPIVANNWSAAFHKFSQELKRDCFKSWFSTFAQQGRAPKAGEVIRLQEHADTLRELASTDGESLYRGALADVIDSTARSHGGKLRKEDLATYTPQWVEPISTNYKGYTVHEIPPNGHGIVALMALDILSGMDIGAFGDAKTLHAQIEAMKLAFADGMYYVAEPSFMEVTTQQLLDKAYSEARRSLIGERAATPSHGNPGGGDTVYMCTADSDGNMVSYIQSNYMGFGSGIVVNGISMQNRGNNFSLNPTSRNCIAPGKRPYHTIIPGFLSKDGMPVGPFGIMGGFMQPQGHVQLIMNTIDFGMNPQEALDAPRWQWTSGNKVEIERGFCEAVSQQLVRLGHSIRIPTESTMMGRGQIIWRDSDGVLAGGTEPRTDGIIAAF